MGRTVRALACLLALVSTLLAVPGQAAPALHLGPPRLTSTHAELRGHAPAGVRSVELQRRSPHGWRAVRRVPVRDGAFRTHLARRRTSQQVRVAGAGRHSEVRRVAARERADACGPRPHKDRSTLWACTFHDDFDGGALDRGRWATVTSYSSGNFIGAGACYLDEPSVVSVGDGALHLSVRQLSAPTLCPAGNPVIFSSNAAGMVSTAGLFSQQYGRFEARYRSAAVAGPGLQEAFWLWPDTRYGSDRPWPASGEIDVAETYSVRPDLAIPFLHYTADDHGGPVPGTTTAWDCTAARGAWHTYTLEWSPTRLEVWVDGRSCLVNTSDDPAFDKRYVVNLTAALGVTNNTYAGGFPLPATMDVDYVRVWQ